MPRRRRPRWNDLLWSVAWTVLLALLPWWLGLPWLFAAAAALSLQQRRLSTRHVALLRRSLRWGLPGVLMAMPRAFGGGVTAWGTALLGALAGYTLLAGLEAWLDRDRRRAPQATASAEWSELAMASIGPVAAIIELQPPLWQAATGDLDDPRGGRVECQADGYRLAEGTRIEGVGPHAAFSPQGGWFAVRMGGDRGVVLWDRDHHRLYRLSGWLLCGWHGGQPWLARREGEMPVALQAMAGRDGDS